MIQVETSWFMGVVDNGRERMPVMVVQPARDQFHEQVLRRLRRASFGRVSRAEWKHGVWPYSSTSAVDVVDGRLVRFTNGTTAFYCEDDPEVTPLWVETGQAQGRALIALVPAGWIGPDDGGDPEAVVRRLGEAADQRQLWAATGAFRVDAFRTARQAS